MLTYLRCLYLPKQPRVPEIQIVSQNARCLAFKCSKKLDAGTSRVAARSRAGTIHLDVDIYHFDQSYGLYEARIIQASQSRESVRELSAECEREGMFGELRERFVTGANVRTNRPLETGSYLRMELDEDPDSGESPTELAEVMWVKPIAGSRHDIRLRFHQKEKIEKLSSLGYLSPILSS